MAADPQPRVPDPEDQFQRSREQQTEGTAQQLAAQAQDPTELFNDKDHWETLAGFDVNRETIPDELEELMATEFSNVYSLGNFDRTDWMRFGFWAENEIHTTLKEFPDADSKVNGTDYLIMYGRREGLNAEEGNKNLKSPLTDEMERRLWSAADAKKAGMTGSIGRANLKSLTEITAVSRTEREEKEEKGRLQRLKEWL